MKLGRVELEALREEDTEGLDRRGAEVCCLGETCDFSCELRERVDERRELEELLALRVELTDGLDLLGADVCCLGEDCGFSCVLRELGKLRDDDICCLTEGLDVDRETLGEGRLELEERETDGLLLELTREPDELRLERDE